MSPQRDPLSGEQSDCTPETGKTLSGKQRRFLRALAHDLRPVLQFGRSGWTPGLEKELDCVLDTHELVKVRVGRECPVELEEASRIIEEATRSHVVQVLGRILVVYRARAKDPTIRLPRRDEA